MSNNNNNNNNNNCNDDDDDDDDDNMTCFQYVFEAIQATVTGNQQPGCYSFDKLNCFRLLQITLHLPSLTPARATRCSIRVNVRLIVL